MKTLGIICIDDEAVVLDNLKEQLQRNLSNGYTCVIEVSAKGEETLAIIEELTNDGIDVALVISDQMMPGMPGEELLIKVHERYPHILGLKSPCG